MSRGRKPGFVMSDEHRVKIQNSNILNALVEHVEGRREMSASQVSAGLGLLKKVMPDLTAATVDATINDERNPNEISGAELDARIAGLLGRLESLASGAAGKATGKERSSDVRKLN